ncbi:hypothetical protein P0O15_07960 [Methanotrichaceae archaeon Mx]|uniref:Acyltransferase n=1 Tax=Candidatus Methanocrinis natronophilus TaxID=3033396 RepID=A0ABT5X949_9EURY|nr:hypothetical protein [Candidatus Methanocrinis natronophilus]
MVRDPAASPSKRSLDRQTATGLVRSGLSRLFFVIFHHRIAGYYWILLDIFEIA